MPATEHHFSDAAPESLYVDTDILISHLVGSQPHHVRCRAFLERLAAEGRTTLYVSSLTWLELANAVTREGFRGALPSIVQQQYRLSNWQDASVRRTYIEAMLSNLDTLLAQFDWVEIPLAPGVRILATTLMADFGLRSQDAIHLASATQVGYQPSHRSTKCIVASTGSICGTT